MSKGTSFTTPFANRKRAEKRVLRAARRYARASARMDLPAMEDTSAEMMLAAFRLLDADRSIAAWKRAARRIDRRLAKVQHTKEKRCGPAGCSLSASHD